MSGVEPKRSRTKLALWALAAVGAAAVFYVIAEGMTKPGAGEGLERFAEGSLKRLTVAGEARPAPSISLRDAAGRPVRIADLEAEVVVVNLWATWCAPCKVEMPTLAALQRRYGERLAVAPVSLDTLAKGPEAQQFIARHPPLRFLHDPNWALTRALSAQGLPVTVIYVDGVERARVTGEAGWDSPEARRLFDALLPRKLVQAPSVGSAETSPAAAVRQ